MADPVDVAASFGYSRAFFDSDPELSALLDRATTQNYTSERFVAELQNTNWFRRSAESQRKWTALQATDPATLERTVSAMEQKILVQATQMGAYFDSPEKLRAYANEFVYRGWSDDAINRLLANQFLHQENGHYAAGRAASIEQQFNQITSDYGIDAGDDIKGWMVSQGVIGNWDSGAMKNWAVQQATSRYPSLAQRLAAGETVRQIADPYIQSQAKLLEVPSDSIDLKDPTIQQALAYKDKNGQPATKTLWEFENGLRQDPRWLKTSNAQNSMMSAAKAVLTDFGIKG